MIDPILITGCARSGTSMTAGIIDICGGFGGQMYGCRNHNKKGMFENKTIRQDIVKPFLSRIGADPKGQKPLPNEGIIFGLDKDFSAKWRETIIAAMKKQGYSDGRWFYKGAKMITFWYLWHQAFPQAKWILVRRTSQDIVSSCMRTHFMSAYRHIEGWERWVEAHVRCMTQLKMSSAPVKEVWPQKMIEGDFTEIKEAIEWMGLTWNEEAVTEFVSPTLWKGGK